MKKDVINGGASSNKPANELWQWTRVEVAEEGVRKPFSETYYLVS